MKPLRVALVIKDSTSTIERDCRNMGYWSYPVPEFEWKHFIFGGKRAYADEMNNYDVVIQEDAGPVAYKHLKKPLVFISIDSTLSEGHLDSRRNRGKIADLILVDHDRLENYLDLGVPVERFNYCVNDRLMRDYGEEKEIDISFYCGSNEERGKIRNMLREYCRSWGLLYATGTLHPLDYARAMARSKIVVNWPRVPGNRPHRVFDAMACGACLVTGPLPDVSGDERVEGRDYVQVEQIGDIPGTIERLIKTGDWQQIGQKGKRLVSKYHTWSIRAKQLRAILGKELGL